MGCYAIPDPGARDAMSDEDEIDTPYGEMDGSTQRYALGAVQRIRFEKKLPTLIVLRGVDAGLRIPLAKTTVTLGRTVDADIVFNDDQISRRHARIALDPIENRYVLSDLGSTNGTFLNDQPANDSHLHDGDKIFLGSIILKFVLQDELESESGEVVDRLMFRDELTGLVVKRRFDSELTFRLNQASVQKQPLALLMMDMDGLKRVNDTHGHAAGSFVIAEVGRIIGELCQERGQACRFGGDEFQAFAVNAPLDQARELGEAIRSAIRSRAFRHESTDLRVTISIGIAAYPNHGRTIDKLVKAADDALYRAKAKGRDTVSD